MEQNHDGWNVLADASLVVTGITILRQSQDGMIEEMSKRKQKRLDSMRKRLKLLDLRIEADTAERNRLRMQAGLLSAEIKCDTMPEWAKNILVHSASPTNSVPRKPVINEYYE